jgi:uncharacterized membrane protein YdfJ with MMPL/SSD domain
MEQQIEKSIFDDFVIDDEIKSQFSEVAPWMKINAIIGFASLGVSVISIVVGLIKISEFGNIVTSTGMMAGTAIGFIITVTISLLLNITLLQAALNIKKAVDANSQQLFAKGMSKLAAYFRIFGIILIVALVIFILAFVFAIAMAGIRGF